MSGKNYENMKESLSFILGILRAQEIYYYLEVKICHLESKEELPEVVMIILL